MVQTRNFSRVMSSIRTSWRMPRTESLPAPHVCGFDCEHEYPTRTDRRAGCACEADKSASGGATSGCGCSGSGSGATARGGCRGSERGATTRCGCEDEDELVPWSGARRPTAVVATRARSGNRPVSGRVRASSSHRKNDVRSATHSGFEVSNDAVVVYEAPRSGGLIRASTSIFVRNLELEDFYSTVEVGPDVPDHVHETVNPHEPWTDDWYEWYGGAVPEGLFGPGAASCDRVRIYRDALQFCCDTSIACDPRYTEVYYVFVDENCVVRDAQCMVLYDSYAGSPDWMPASTTSSWSSFIAWVSDAWDDDIYTEEEWENESGYDQDLDDDDFDDNDEASPARCTAYCPTINFDGNPNCPGFVEQSAIDPAGSCQACFSRAESSAFQQARGFGCSGIGVCSFTCA